MTKKASLYPVFWTSGWDSTYMVIQLLRAGKTVQPIYIENPRRKSRRYEISALNQLSDLIRQRISTGQLLPVKIYSLDDITIDPEITSAFEQLNANAPKHQRPLGYQYRYLASFVKQHRDEYPKVGLGIERAENPDSCACSGAIRRLGHLTSDNEIDPSRSDPALVTLLGNFYFPIIGITEPEMRQNIQKWHYDDIMQHIWFCHRPIQGRPCGFCNPCSSKVLSGMDFLLPSDAKVRCQKFSRIEQRFGRRVRQFCDWIYHFFHR